MNLDQLRCVVALAEDLHFARAARRLGLQQPQLSRRLRRLEDELGVELFERTTREVRITPAGRAFAEDARRSLEHADRAARNARQVGRGEVGRLAIGFVGSAANTLLPPVLRRFRGRYPGVELDLRELPSVRQAEELVAGGLDVGILHAPVTGAARDVLATREFARGPLLALLPAGHPHAHRDPLPVTDLADEAFVLFPRGLGLGLHSRVLQVTRAAGFEPRVVQEAVQMQTIVGLVAAGMGVSIVPWTVAGGGPRPPRGVPPPAPPAPAAPRRRGRGRGHPRPGPPTKRA
ncbi:LysR substrate-binding domain-containing protein, partial [Actinomadura viridis]|uniref:LysR substrate-binding domain-containing protein n=1 Tax=Actinomadura viridis TaxID=58110 RepID=UPI0036968828